MNKDDGIIRKLYRQEKLNVEQEFVKDVHYEVITGSTSYNMRTEDSESDTDVVGICIPPIDYVLPHSVGGFIDGFGPSPPKFNNFQQHHIFTEDGNEYDVAVYSIIKFFQLAAENNPNICDILFVNDKFITHIDNIGKLIRQNRKLFLTRHSYHKFLGYAFAQSKKMKTRNPEGGRKEYIEKCGYDVKHAAHLVRLLLECEQILVEHDLDLERNGELLRSIRRGEWSLEDVEKYFKERELNLNKLYAESTLRYSPDWDELRRILFCCLEEKFHNIANYINVDGDSRVLRKYEQIVQIINS